MNVNNKSPEVKTTRLTKTNVEQIDGDEENNYKTVETDRSILDKFNNTAKKSRDASSQRSNSVQATRKTDADIINLKSSYDDKMMM